MITLHDTYQFFITTPQHGTWQAYPENDKLQWVWKKEDDSAFYRLELNTTLKFKNNAAKGVTDFTKLYELERSEDRCDFVPIEINRKCGDGWFSFWQGYIAVIDGDFDVSKCVLEIKPRIDDEYRCINGKLDTVQNILEVQSEPNVGNIPGIIEENRCCSIQGWSIQLPPPQPTDFGINSNCIDPSEGWVFVENRIELVGNDPNQQEDLYEVCSVFVREVAPGTCDGSTPEPPPGSGWILILDNCPSSSLWARPTTVFTKVSYPGGRKLRSVTEFLAGDCVSGVISDFFGWDPDNTAPNNSAYAAAAASYQDILVFQKSDVRFPNNPSPATRGEMTLKELLESLRVHFNVYWYIESGKLRIEHKSYFEDGVLMLDLTQDDFKPFIAGKHKFKYLSEQIPKSETWQAMERTTFEFDGVPVTYSDTCSYDQDAKNVEYSVGRFTNDLLTITENRDRFSDDGFCLAARIGNAILTEPTLINGNNVLNGPMAFPNLLYRFHRYGRPQRSGNMNNQDEVFLSWEPKREQVELSFPMCCDDLLNTFDPKDKVRTQLGWGIISECQMEDPGLWFQIKTRHL